MKNIKIFVSGFIEYGTWLSDNLVDNIEYADLVVFTGGNDVSPALYDEKPHETTNFDSSRDLRELRLFEKCKKLKKSCLGICRGSQMLTILNNGKIIQNVDSHALWGTHKVEFGDGSVMQATSTHHQMMMPFNLHPEDYKIIAKSYPRRSSYYQTGFGEYMEEDIPCEPEIVFYPKTRSLAIQSHPEYMDSNSDFVVKCKELIKEYLL